MMKRCSIMLVCLALAACDGRSQARFQGSLYFAQGAYVMRFSLQNAGLSVVGHLGDTVIRDLSELGSGDLLVAETASVNRLKVPRISWFNPATGEAADLYPGLFARHLPGPSMVVYDDGSSLVAVPQQNERPNVTVYNHPPNQLTVLLAAGPDVALFEVVEEGEPVIRSWNAITGEHRALEGLTRTCRLEGAVWVDSLERLVCRRRDGLAAEAEHVIAGLDGRVDTALALDSGDEYRVLAYSAAQEVLVVQQIWHAVLDSRDRYAVLLLDLESGETHRVADNVNLGSAVVFADYH